MPPQPPVNGANKVYPQRNRVSAQLTINEVDEAQPEAQNDQDEQKALFSTHKEYPNVIDLEKEENQVGDSENTPIQLPKSINNKVLQYEIIDIVSIHSHDG